MYQGMTALSFSVARGGDWIDECVSVDTGVSKAKVTNIKESSKNYVNKESNVIKL